ncbi:RNA pyrophosphohydrolase [Gymnodinialimonas hymeniacidonis]|uniref:RNA pyrophosphohydrolase n=1 Tax=Gymnodinialimonas hymeniacidonis TaxID=3126508 RepID=UPI0034C6DB7E
MTPEEAAKLPYRPCVGVVLTNAQGLIFAGQRADMETPAWQMPQGGVDEGETPLEAAYRELEEETGVGRGHVSLVCETADWLYYDLPLDVIPNRWNGRFRGQKQKWAQFRLDATDDVIDLNYKDVEFSAWRWMSAPDILNAIVAFKRDIYAAVFEEFGL